MPIDRSSMNRFIAKLPDFLSESEIKIIKRKLPGRSETNWDTPARLVMMDKFSSWLNRELGLNQVEIADALFVEGVFGSLPTDARGEFFGSVCCPDLALKGKDGYKIAVELDHGTSGSKLRDALTKASFNVIVGGFDRSIVLFFVEYKTKKKRETKFDSNHFILKLFEERFSTSILFVTNYQPMP